MDYPEIGEVFNDDARKDPYGVFANIVAEAFKLADSHEGSMSDLEAAIVYETRHRIIQLDPATRSLFGLGPDEPYRQSV